MRKIGLFAILALWLGLSAAAWLWPSGEISEAERRNLQQFPTVSVKELFSGDWDVAVCDGFVGNVILKHTEGFAKSLFKMMKTEMMASTRTKLGAAMVKPALMKVKDKMDYNSVGGAPMLGVEGAVVKAHGSSGAQAIANAVRQARQMLEGDVVGRIREGLAGLGEE